jgi:cytosine/adenosine deaminase-related metal-dependent hydrolase
MRPFKGASMNTGTGAFLLTVALRASAALAAEQPADIVLAGGRIWTADTARPWVEALAIRGNRIVYAGDARGAEAFRGPGTQAIALAGRLVTPGFNDAHSRAERCRSSGWT